MKAIRLVLSLSLVMAFTAVASETVVIGTGFDSHASTPADTFTSQSNNSFTLQNVLTDIVFSSGEDSDPDSLMTLALKSLVIKPYITALADNARISEFSNAQWYVIRGPPLV